MEYSGGSDGSNQMDANSGGGETRGGSNSYVGSLGEGSFAYVLVGGFKLHHEPSWISGEAPSRHVILCVYAH